MVLPADGPTDEGLRHLLAVERRLQDLVRAAREESARRIAAAHEEAERRLAAARQAAEREDDDLARAERVAQEQALAAVETAHHDALRVITSISDRRVDELARRALSRAIDVAGEAM